MQQEQKILPTTFEMKEKKIMKNHSERQHTFDESTATITTKRLPNKNACSDKYNERMFDSAGSNSSDRRSFHEATERPIRKLEKSASERRPYYGEREIVYEQKKTDIFVDDSTGVERLSFYSDRDKNPQVRSFYSEHDVLRGDGDRHDFYEEDPNAFYNEEELRRDNQAKFYDEEVVLDKPDRRSFYAEQTTDNLEGNSDQARCKYYSDNDLNVDDEVPMRRKYLSESEGDRRNFAEMEDRRKSISLRQELRNQRSTFSESIDSGSSRSQLSNFHCESNEYAEKMLKSSRSYLTESDCCRLGATSSSAHEASGDDGSPQQAGVFHTGAESKYVARKRARKCSNHRRQKSLDTGRCIAEQESASQGELKQFRSKFDLDDDLVKRLDRMEPKASNYLRRSSRKSSSRFDLNFDSEDERCFRHSLDVDRSFDLDMLDTRLDDRYGSFDRDFDLV